MNKTGILVLLLLSIGMRSHAQTRIDSIMILNFDDVIQMAHNQSVASLREKTTKENNYWQYQSFNSGYLPKVNLGSSVPGIDKSHNINLSDSGTQIIQQNFRSVSNLNLSANQLIGITGGSVSLSSDLNASYDILHEDVAYSYRPINLNWAQPLFQFNEHPWNRKIEKLRFEESNKEYILQMEQISINTSRLYFDLMLAQIEREIASLNVANNDTILKIARGRYELGKIAENELLQIELQYIRSTQAFDQATIDIQNSQLALKNYIGLTNDKELTLILPDLLLDVDIDLSIALEKAKFHRPEIIKFEWQRLEAEKNLKRAIRDNGLNANLNISVGLSNAASEFGMLNDIYSNNEQFNVRLSIPILDWGKSKAEINQAKASKQLTIYNIEQQMINFEEEIFAQINSFILQKKQVQIAKKADEIALKRFEVTKNRYLIGNITITDMNIATTEKDAAKKSYVNALKNYWVSYYTIRKLTLYDFIFKEDLIDVNE